MVAMAIKNATFCPFRGLPIIVFGYAYLVRQVAAGWAETIYLGQAIDVVRESGETGGSMSVTLESKEG